VPVKEADPRACRHHGPADRDKPCERSTQLSRSPPHSTERLDLALDRKPRRDLHAHAASNSKVIHVNDKQCQCECAVAQTAAHQSLSQH
jgi:hypothetical protein